MLVVVRGQTYGNYIGCFLYLKKDLLRTHTITGASILHRMCRRLSNVFLLLFLSLLLCKPYLFSVKSNSHIQKSVALETRSPFLCFTVYLLFRGAKKYRFIREMLQVPWTKKTRTFYFANVVQLGCTQNSWSYYILGYVGARHLWLLEEKNHILSQCRIWFFRVLS